nr:FkbM family methyltransferase [Aliarcobacter thereius]
MNNPRWYDGTRLTETISMECLALDRIPNLPKFDLLKIDIQCGELNVFKNVKQVLKPAICVIPEVGFFPLYENAPDFADVHNELINQGFLFHKFMFQKQVHLHGSLSSNRKINGIKNQLIDGDAVYIRDPRKLTQYDTDMLKKFLLLAHFVFDSKDLAILILDELVKRDVVSNGILKGYLDLV